MGEGIVVTSGERGERRLREQGKNLDVEIRGGSMGKGVELSGGQIHTPRMCWRVTTRRQDIETRRGP